MGRRSKPELTPRLRLLADWVPDGTRLADVGTDHGHLPICLLLERRISRAVACDLRPGPLSRARENADACGVSERMDFRLCDGLAEVRPEEAETIVVAGMGGENIADILRAAPWTADGRHTLLLQPMTRPESLRSFLADGGYRIVREQLVWDRGTLYPVLQAGGGRMDLSLGQRYGGAALTRDPLEDRYLIGRILQFQSAVAGRSRASDSAGIDGLREIVTALLQMREEWRHANSADN